MMGKTSKRIIIILIGIVMVICTPWLFSPLFPDCSMNGISEPVSLVGMLPLLWNLFAVFIVTGSTISIMNEDNINEKDKVK